MKTVSTNKAPAAIGPYSQAQIVGGMVYTSGQIGIDPATGIVPEGVEAQAHQVSKTSRSFSRLPAATCPR